MKRFQFNWDSANWSLLIWAQFFGLILVGGFHIYYLAPFQVWMLGMGLVLLIAMIVAGAMLPKDKDHAHDHDHHQERGERFFIYLIPLLLFVWVGPKPLGVQAMQGKSPFMAPGSVGDLEGELPEDLENFQGYFPTNMYSLYRISALTTKKHPVAMDGVIYHPPPHEVPEELSSNNVHTLLFHFIITCCAADARPLSVVLDGPGVIDMPDGTWVRVQGRAEKIPGSGMLMFRADRVERIPEPEYPYLLRR